MCATEAHGRVMADGIEVSLVTLNIMESKTLKTHANAYISRGRPTLKDVEHFRKGSVREIYERSIYERTFTSAPKPRTSKTLSSIVDNGKRLCDSLSLDMNSPSNKNLPKSVDFCGVEVILDLKGDIIEGVLLESVQSKSVLQNIIKNKSEFTGFLIWFASFGVSCISKSIPKRKYVYSLLVYDESQMTPVQYTNNINRIACPVRLLEMFKKHLIQQNISKYSLCHVQPNLLTRMNEKG